MCLLDPSEILETIRQRRSNAACSTGCLSFVTLASVYRSRNVREIAEKTPSVSDYMWSSLCIVARRSVSPLITVPIVRLQNPGVKFPSWHLLHSQTVAGVPALPKYARWLRLRDFEDLLPTPTFDYGRNGSSPLPGFSIHVFKLCMVFQPRKVFVNPPTPSESTRLSRLQYGPQGAHLPVSYTIGYARSANDSVYPASQQLGRITADSATGWISISCSWATKALIMVGGNRVSVSVPPHHARDVSAKPRRSNLKGVEANDDSYEITPPNATYAPDSDSYPEPNDNRQNEDGVQINTNHQPVPKPALRGGFKEPILARGRDTWWKLTNSATDVLLSHRQLASR
ncbi:hypothetical protein F5141DRAFT_1065182 [Pisolithus sp. B1]|nr:hypothetical protein F5141DRAFT_1065182 [Pisolithus sp. B1]